MFNFYGGSRLQMFNYMLSLLSGSTRQIHILICLTCSMDLDTKCTFFLFQWFYTPDVQLYVFMFVSGS